MVDKYRPKRYTYPFKIIMLCMAFKLQSSASFRAIKQMILLLNINYSLSTRAPSHSTILLWVKKYGFYELAKPKQIGDDWVIILDESVQFGQNKLLVIYGIRHSNIDFTRPLNYQDLVTLTLISKSTWSGEDIKKEFIHIEKQIGKIKYAVADYGSAIKKSLKLAGISHVYDLTHFISLSVEHIYREDPVFKAYTKEMAHLRATQALGKMAHVLPPVQRHKARFMNLRPISDWGVSVLNLLDNPDEHYSAEKQNLSWVNQYRDFIRELALLNKFINAIQSTIKNNGLSKLTVQKCKQILSQSTSDRLIQFRNKVCDYFQQIFNNLPDLDRVLCTSDILESAFGKYKNYLQANPMVGITNLCLSISAFTGEMNPENLKDAFEKTTVNNIKQWTEKNIGETTLSKRLKVLKNGT